MENSTNHRYNLVQAAERVFAEEHPYLRQFKQAKSSIEGIESDSSVHGPFWPTLMPNVARCLSFEPQHLFNCDSFCQNVFQDNFIQWDKLSWEILTAPGEDEQSLDVGDMNDEEKQFFRGSIRLKQFSIYLERLYSNQGKAVVEKNYGTLLDTIFSHYYPNIFGIFDPIFATKDTNIDIRTNFAIGVAILERLLGEIFCHVVVRKDTPCPRILRDLLATPEMIQTLPKGMMAVLINTIGPPYSLNLRNLTWHGFASPREFAPSFLSLLLALMVSIAKFVVDSGFSATLKPRPLLRLDTVSDELFDFGQGAHFFPSLPNFIQDYEEDIRNLFRMSSFVIPSSLQTLVETVTSLKHVETINVPLERHRVAVTLLPVFEHCMRRLFVSSNKLSDHLLCAVSRGYFTTMDMFLEQTISAGDPATEGKPNVLLEELGNPFFQLLFDVFTHPAGRRLRDRLSHGEADPSTVTIAYLDRMIGLFIALCVQYHPARGDFLEQCPAPIRRCHQFCFADYVSCFHPRSLIQRSLFQLSSTIDRTQTILDRYPSRPANPDDEDESVRYRRTEQPESIHFFTELVEKLGEFEEILKRSKDSLHRRSSPFTANSELISLNSFITITRMFQEGSGSFCDKISELERIQSEEKAPVRQKVRSAAFSKLLGFVEPLQLGQKAVGLTLALIEQRGRDQKMEYPVKALSKITSSYERYLKAFSDNKWPDALEQISEVSKGLRQLLAGSQRRESPS